MGPLVYTSIMVKIFLGELRTGAKGVIVHTGGPVELRNRLLEMGFLEGATIELLHEAPFGRDPIAVRVRGSVLALRRNEANSIEVRVERRLDGVAS